MEGKKLSYLGKGTLCVWRIVTNDSAYFTPIIGYIVDDDREKTVSWIKSEPKSGEPVRRYLFEVVYTHHAPVHMHSERDIKRQYVGFYYRPDGSVPRSDVMKARALGRG